MSALDLLQAPDPASELTPPEAVSFVAAGNTVAVDLGSMPRMGFVPDAAGFVAALRGALRAAGLRGLLLTGAGVFIPFLCGSGDPKCNTGLRSLLHKRRQVRF